MSEKKYLIQNFVPVTAAELLERVKDLMAGGYRLGQICATNAGDDIELLYSFDKGHDLLNLKLTVAARQEIISITSLCWSAFIYENEIHDLFGVPFRHSELDYGGHFFKLSRTTPWCPTKKGEEDEYNG